MPNTMLTWWKTVNWVGVLGASIFSINQNHVKAEILDEQSTIFITNICVSHIPIVDVVDSQESLSPVFVFVQNQGDTDQEVEIQVTVGDMRRQEISTAGFAASLPAHTENVYAIEYHSLPLEEQREITFSI